MSEKVLLETEFEDSTLEKELFNVKIIQHFSNPVFGDAVEVDITHPEESFVERYSPAGSLSRQIKI